VLCVAGLRSEGGFNEREVTPLHEATRSGRLSVVKQLVERGAGVKLKNVDSLRAWT